MTLLENDLELDKVDSIWSGKGMQLIISKYIHTDNPVIDNIILSTILLVISALINGLKFDNFAAIFKWISKQFRRSRAAVEPMNCYIITDKTVLDEDGDALNDEMDNFHHNNNKFLEAFYYYLDLHYEIASSAEIGIEWNVHDHEDLTFRDFQFKTRPTDTVVIDDMHIHFKQEKEQEEVTGGEVSEDDSNLFRKNKSKTKRMVGIKQIMISSHKSIPEIRQFIRDVYTKYIDYKYPLKNHEVDEKKPPKYYYIWKKPEVDYFSKTKNDKTKTGGKGHYVKYPLKSKITFDDVFFPGKEKLIKHIDRFMANETKLSKFSILLHGDPGGGKSTFIKALHNHTKCHIIVVRLKQFDSLDQLIELFHNETIRIKDSEGDSWTKEVPNATRIYLFEDIDAEDKLVHKRRKEKKRSRRSSNNNRNELDKSCTNTMWISESRNDKGYDDKGYDNNNESEESHESDDDSDSDDRASIPMSVDSFYSSEGDCQAPANTKPLTRVRRQRHREFRSKTSGMHAIRRYGPMGHSYGNYGGNYGEFDKQASLWSKKNWWEEEKDVTLSGILNILDGVLELNDCFVVITTNHVEKLDPALIRPGRITHNIRLGFISEENMRLMIHKFIPSYDPSEPYPILDRLLSKIHDTMMPCQFEQFCQNETTIEEVIQNITHFLDPPEGACIT